MSTSPSQNGVLRFGVFEIDLQQGELRRAGLRQKLGPQPFQVLQALLERPGEIVTKDELRQRLWPDQTFVDYDLALKKCINRIRELLGDSAESPRFVETVPRRGYRFVAPVQYIEATGNWNGRTLMARSTTPAASSSPDVSPGSREEFQVPQTEIRKRHLKVVRVVPLVAAVLLTVLVLGYFWVRPELPPKASNYVQLTNDGQPKQLIGTDGARLYLYLDNGDYHGLAELLTTGGEIKKLPILPPDLAPMNLSPDGTEILAVGRRDFTGAGPVFAVPVVGGTPRRLGAFIAQSATLSPDETLLAYSNQGDLFVSRRDGSQARRIVSLKDQLIYNLVWSPNGDSLRFFVQENVDTLPNIWEIALDGSGLHPLFPEFNGRKQWQWGGAWTPSGKYFLFWCARHIWALPRKRNFLSAASNPIELTSSPLGLFPPVPSRDGKKLYLIGAQRRGQLVRYDQKSKQFEPYLGGASSEQLAFSRDGKWVAYVSFPEGSLWRSRTDGSEQAQLTHPKQGGLLNPYALGPDWSPDGKKILFFEDAASHTPRIYVISADGDVPQELLPDDPGPQTAPSWSPDGTKVLFSGRSNDPKSSIRIFDLNIHRISTVPGSQGMFSPRWSPDGRYVAALSGNGTQLLLFDFQRGAWTEIARGQMLGFPSFTSNGHFLQFSSEAGLMKYDLRSHTTRAILDYSKFVGTGYFGFWTGTSPDGSPLLLRDAGTQDVYWLDWEEP